MFIIKKLNSLWSKSLKQATSEKLILRNTHSNNALILNAMAKSYSKNPNPDAVQLTIDALLSNFDSDPDAPALRSQILSFLK